LIQFSVIIITWNAKHFLTKCLKSVYEKNRGFQFELILIDNNSSDGSVEYVQSNFPQVKLILNKNNRGVGPARNQGLKIATGKYILILDVDTELITENTFEKTYEFMESNPGTGILGAKLLFPDNSLQYTCKRFPSVWVKLFNRFEKLEKIRNSQIMREHYMFDIDHNETQKVDYVIGAFQLLRKDMVDKIGCYDEEIFYGPEDIDFCLRARIAGYDTVYFPEVELYHFCQRITKKLFTKATFEHIKGLFYFFRKHKYISKPKLENKS